MERARSRRGLADLLSRVEAQARGRLAELLRTSDVGVAEWRVLQLLADGLGHPVSDVARAVMLPAATVTRLIDRMVSKNLVYRRADDEDRRRLLVFMTERGTRLYRTLEPLVARHEEELMEAMGAESGIAIATLHRLDGEFSAD